MLEVTMDPHVPHVCEIRTDDLVAFCQERGYQCRMEPAGSLLIPPDYNVGLTDWERSRKLRDGLFNVLEMDPMHDKEGQRAGGQVQTALRSSPLSGGAHPWSGLGGGAMSEADLNALRLRLESLLPPS